MKAAGAVPLRTVFCRDGVSPQAVPHHTRIAVRGVVMCSDRLLMVHSAATGDYKFPGGGQKPGETDELTLEREIAEECGRRICDIGRKIAITIEYSRAAEAKQKAFRMISHYYLCSVEQGTRQALTLDGYEENLGFKPVLISIQQALECNEALLSAPATMPPRWTERETWVLRSLATLELG